MASCPDETTMLALVEGRLTRLIAMPLQRHIDTCRACQAAAAEAARTLTPAAAMAPRAVRRELWPGAVLSERFVLDHIIGRGGVGEVWRARRAGDGSAVAIKVLHQVTAEQTRRLAREARLSQRASQHPAFVPVHELLALESGRLALIMDLLKGEDLAACLERQGRLSITECLGLLATLSDALIALHRQRIAHRDLKPANVFLEKESGVRLRILDLGMARSLDLERSMLEASRLTAAGTVLGTPHYMAPEQLDGARDVDGRADIWALGAIAYRMLSGTPHIDAWRLSDVARALHTRAIVELRAISPDVPERVAELVMRSLSLSPSARPQAELWLQAVRETDIDHV